MVSVNIASIPLRKNLLIKTIDSLIDQVDIVNLYLNNYTENPYPHKKVNFVFGDNSLGDAGKFYFVSKFDGYYFTVDDDIIYPKNYIIDTIALIDKYGVVSYHGRTFINYPISSYYNSPAIRNRCLNSYDFTEPIDIPGTGVMGFHTSKFKPDYSIFKKKNMSDIWIGCYAKSIGLNIWGLKHSEGYFKYQFPKNTIYNNKVNDDYYETNIVNDNFI